MHYNLYRLIGNNMIILSYTCSPIDSLKGKFFIGEIFYHTIYNKDLIANPLDKITAVIVR